MSQAAGVALLRAIAGLDALELTGDQETGLNIVRRTLLSPVRAIAENAGEEGSVVVAKVQAGEGNFGFNAATCEYSDMLEAGIVDPTKVVRSALQNASSIAGLLLTTETLITDVEEPPVAAPAADPHAGHFH